MQTEFELRELDRTALTWAYRGVWIVCVAVYLIVFIGGIMAGGAKLVSMVRAVGFTLVALLLGRVALVFVSRATGADRQLGPTAAPEEPVGSPVDLVGLTNVAQQHDELPEAA